MTISSIDAKYYKKQKNNYCKENAILKVLFKKQKKKEVKEGIKSKKIGTEMYQNRKN